MVVSFYQRKQDKRRHHMKGYYIESGYMGYVDGRYVLFADEQDYKEMMEESES